MGRPGRLAGRQCLHHPRQAPARLGWATFWTGLQDLGSEIGGRPKSPLTTCSPRSRDLHAHHFHRAAGGWSHEAIAGQALQVELDGTRISTSTASRLQAAATQPGRLGT